MLTISDTRITTKNLCDRRHYYSYILGYKLKNIPLPMYMGHLGHTALEQYYLEMKEDSPVDVCKAAALSIIDKEIARIAAETPEEFEYIQVAMYLRKLIEGYAEVYRIEQFKVLEVEKEFRTSVIPGVEFLIRLDTLVEMTKGEYRGDTVVVDHKFVYNFKSILDISMDAQLPKYIKTLSENGYFVTKGMFNQIRTRKMKISRLEDLYKRTWLKSKKAEIDQIWAEQQYVAKDLVYRESLTKEEVSRISPRTMSFSTCRSCMYQPPCKAELDGDDISQMLDANYKKTDSDSEMSDND